MQILLAAFFLEKIDIWLEGFSSMTQYFFKTIVIGVCISSVKFQYEKYVKKLIMIIKKHMKSLADKINTNVVICVFKYLFNSIFFINPLVIWLIVVALYKSIQK